MTLRDDLLARIKSKPATARELIHAIGCNAHSASQVLHAMKRSGVLSVKKAPSKSKSVYTGWVYVYSWTEKEGKKKTGGPPRKWPEYLRGHDNPKRQFATLERYRAALESYGFTVTPPINGEPACNA